MAAGFLNGIKRVVLWDYPRASWQYDVMVGCILAFLFLTPREWFRDQPRIASASDIAMLPAENGANVFFFDNQLLEGVPEAQRYERAGELLRLRTQRRQTVRRLEPVFDADGDVKGYMAFARP
jgi:hypothetical protein